MAIDTNEIRAKLDDGWKNMHPVDIIKLCDEIDRLRAEANQPAAPPAGNTVRVRVAVAVDIITKTWSAVGQDNYTDQHSMDVAKTGVSRFANTYWLTADIPVPKEIDVAAKVEVDRATSD